MDRATQKRNRLIEGLRAAEPVVAVGAHDAMSAKMIERHGFDAVWVSGLGVATMGYALPDLNIVTMSESLDAARRVDGATSLPVISDCDNGFGGLLNVVRTVQEFEQAGISAVCIEDNHFPKRNSLFAGDAKRELIPAKEQARRFRAAKKAQVTDEFMVIARIESLIAGHGVVDACERADAYVDAGVDAILIHSVDREAKDIDEFLASWGGVGSVPVVSVPTKYPTFGVEDLKAKGFDMVIFANHPMRAAVKAMDEILEVLKTTKRASVADESIVTVADIFAMVDTQAAIRLDED